MGHQANVAWGERSPPAMASGALGGLQRSSDGPGAPRTVCIPASLLGVSGRAVDRRSRCGTRPYTPSVGAFLAPFVSHLGVVLAGLGALFLAGVLVVVHRVRARWRALRARADIRAGLSWIASWRANGGRGGPSRWRYELWQSVTDATRALKGAEAAVGGPIGELRSLNRRLRATAEELDRLLAVAAGMPPSTPEVAEVRSQVGDALAASSAIRKAALASASSTTGVRAGELASDAVREVESVASGVERIRVVLSTSPPYGR